MIQFMMNGVTQMHRLTLCAALPLALIACNSSDKAVASGDETEAVAAISPVDTIPFETSVVGQFDEPWAMTFLPDGRALVTEKKGKLKLVTFAADGKISSVDVSGTPTVAYGGQGGLGDVVLSPDFVNDGYVYLSFAEAGDGDTSGAAVARAKLVMANDGAASLKDMQVLWRQEPKVSGKGHYGHRIAFGPDGMMYISSGERQKFDPAQDLDQNLGKVIRLTPTGGIPSDNPMYDQGRIKAQAWSWGHRNPLGLAFDNAGNLWELEMGPKGGDELNLVKRGANYGYPKVSNGDHYDGKDIPDHAPGDGFEPPKVFWNPAISPGSLMIYSGDLFPAWKGSAFIGALGAQALVRVKLGGDTAEKADNWTMEGRIREVEQGPDGAIWLLEDGARGSKGRLLKLTPPK
ncbi:PQQ-dependent sugar dehydrogenase [Blastomonas sp. CCH8-A3]|uniref:PQQ-dependent sugar dehydrogenase n=3 Tax=Pseudomonadota TaxID=1224 RepID=UPI000AD8DA0C|nr:PQQ-dependent sugar dehydrogenase [Blastomonas sp. CCH8-A3]MAF62700.1 glucose dehydrogenase [Blastomonas sp.]